MQVSNRSWIRRSATLLGALVLVLGGGTAVAGGSPEASEREELDAAQEATGTGSESDAAAEAGPPGIYTTFSDAAFAAAADMRRVYFFHASWCPTCRAADRAFSTNEGDIPSGVAVFKIDYDSATELRRTFGVTYQHTFVIVDEQGTLVRRWSGGDIAALIRNTQGDS